MSESERSYVQLIASCERALGQTQHQIRPGGSMFRHFFQTSQL